MRYCRPYGLVDWPSELLGGIQPDGCSAGGVTGGVSGIGWGSIVGIGAGAGSGFGIIFFFGLAFFFAIRFAFFFAPFLAFRFLAKQSHRPIVEVGAVISLLGNFP
jgi:hypothetical protein